jgi:Ca2+-binding RTX toxin-like protein
MPLFKISSVATIVASVIAGAAVAASPLSTSRTATVVPPAYFVGTAGSDTIYGTPHNDVLLGKGGNDTIYALPGNDVAEGGTGNDRIYGGKGHDVLRGGPGNDRLYARDGSRDVVIGGPGFDEAWVDRFDKVRGVEVVHRR